MTVYEDARYQVRWHQDNGRLVGAVDLILAALKAGEAAEAKLVEAEREQDRLRDENQNLASYEEAYRECVQNREAAESREKALLAIIGNAIEPHSFECPVFLERCGGKYPIEPPPEACTCGVRAVLAVGKKEA